MFQQQLEKYGYLHCRVQSRHKRSFFPAHFDEGGVQALGAVGAAEGGLPPCTSREVRKAIKQYQKRYHLPETGVIDRRTKRLMSTSRCGNSDKEEEELEGVAEEELQLQVNERTSSSDVLSNLLKQGPTDLNNVPIGSFLSDHFKSQPWKRSTSETNSMLDIISGARRKRRDISSSSLNTRTRYVKDYIQRLKSDPEFLKRESQNKINNVLKINNLRKKRSVAVTEHIEKSSQVYIPRVTDGQKFEKQVIRWRLLESGYSTRIPVEDQRSTLDLAFRMWSEVIPLNFLEVTDGDVGSVDIEIAFGTGKHSHLNLYDSSTADRGCHTSKKCVILTIPKT